MKDLILLGLIPVTAFILNTIFIPLIIRFAEKRKLYDVIDDRKIHTGQIPRLGGIGIVSAFFIGILATLLIYRPFSEFLKSADFFQTFRGGPVSFVLYLAALMLIFAFGIFDDLKTMKARYKLIVQIAAAALVLAAGLRFESLAIPFLKEPIHLGWFSYILSFIWIIGITNSVNLIDGMDGLAGGTSFISLGFAAYIGFATGNIAAAMICLIAMGSVAGFLVYNLPPARIFMGDCGSLFLGFLLATLPMTFKGTFIEPAAIYIFITLLIIPITDTLAAIIRRTFIKKIHFFNPDKEHTHHKLLDCKLTVSKALTVVYSIVIISGITTVIWTRYSGSMSYLLMIFSWISVVMFYLILSKLSRKMVKK